MNKFFTLLLIFAVISANTFAQKASVSGILSNSETGENIYDATIQVLGTTLSAKSEKNRSVTNRPIDDDFFQLGASYGFFPGVEANKNVLMTGGKHNEINQRELFYWSPIRY